MDNKVKLTFRIQFIDKDLLPNGTNWFDSQIEVDEDQIVLVVKSKLDTILSSLMILINEDYSRFNNIIHVDNALDCNGHNVTVDFMKTCLMNFGGREYLDHSEKGVLLFQIDYISYSYDLQKEIENNNARFLLTDIDISKYRMTEKTYNIFNTECSPNFQFICYDKYDINGVLLQKIPVIEWNLFPSVNDVLEYNKMICTLISFYFLLPITFYSAEIEYNKTRTIIYQRTYNKNNIFDKKAYYTNSTHFLVKSLKNVDDYIKSVKYERIKDKFSNIEVVIRKLFQSLLLDNETKYLILYSIIENCSLTGSPTGKVESKFNNLVDIEKKYDASLEFILDAVKENEQEDFKKRWNAGWSCIQYKPAKRAIIEFIESKKLSYKRINEYVRESSNKRDIIKLRNVITHGSYNISNTKFDNINDLMSLICTILIIDMLEITDVKLYDSLPYHDIILK